LTMSCKGQRAQAGIAKVLRAGGARRTIASV
jgi:hypothetical protein